MNGYNKPCESVIQSQLIVISLATTTNSTDYLLVTASQVKSEKVGRRVHPVVLKDSGVGKTQDPRIQRPEGPETQRRVNPRVT